MGGIILNRSVIVINLKRANILLKRPGLPEWIFKIYFVGRRYTYSKLKHRKGIAYEY